MPERYILVTQTDPANLVKAVNELIRQGYAPSGGATHTYGPLKRIGRTVIDGPLWSQAMVMTDARWAEWQQ